MSKQSTIIHHDMLAIVHEMPDEMAGRFVKILHAAMISDIPLPEDFSLKMAIMPFISQIKRDQEKYNSVCDRNRKNIEKRWINDLPNDTRNTTGINGIPDLPLSTRNTDSDNGSDNDNDNEKEKNKDLGDKPTVSVPSKKKLHTTTLPDNFEISESLKNYAGEKGYRKSLDALTESFCLHHKAKGSRFSDWDAAWKKWMRNDLEWNGGGADDKNSKFM